MDLSRRTLQHLKSIQRELDQLRPDAPPQALLVPGSPRKPRATIIIFTGSFNPPTTAHLALLKQGQQYAHQQEPQNARQSGQSRNSISLYAAFSKVTVNKEKLERPLLLDRVLLLQQILRRRLPRVGLLLFNRGLYVEQAQAIRHSFPAVKRIYFLMGYDKIVQIFDPQYYQDRDSELEALFQEAQMLVAPRGSGDEAALRRLLEQPENRRFARYVHAIPFNPIYRDISSTSIRAGNHAYDSAIPHEVRTFMRKTRAYAPPLQKKDGTEVDYYKERALRLNTLIHTV
jgi:nicotinic acid mononucleotide adenylyltransferase